MDSSQRAPSPNVPIGAAMTTQDLVFRCRLGTLAPQRSNRVCRQDKTSESLRFVTRANPCAATLGDRIPWRAHSLHRPKRNPCHDSNATERGE